MIRIQNLIQNLRKEAQAMKVAFERSATAVALITKTTSFQTKKNLVTEDGFSYEDLERVVVTLAGSEGANTIAKLEVAGDYDTVPIVRRVPFSGGARWVVTTAAKYSGGAWAPTTYQFTVHSLVRGELSAKMIWE